jgi:phosphate transport system substrate-binding protein
MRAQLPLVVRAVLVGALAALQGCTPWPAPARPVIRIGGSDTMVNLVQAWAESYAAVRPEVTVQVGGGGSGVGIAQWLQGTLDIAASSRDLESSERARAEARWGAPPRVEMVALDAIAVFVARANPIEAVTLRQLGDIYGVAPRITRWSDLSVHVPGCRGDEIVRVGRQNSSGTFHVFRSHTLGSTREYQLGSIDLSGSREVVSLVGQTPCAIGYSGLAYATPEVKVLRLARGGEAAIAPSAETVRDGRYPLARSLWLCATCDVAPQVAAFLDWILSAEGQRVAADLGFVPAPGSR